MESTCRICDMRDLVGKRLTNHVKRIHGLSSEDYTLAYVMKISSRPTCAVEGCTEHVRYVSLTFKKYCKSHASLKQSESGKIGGHVKKQWNKGRTAADTPQLAKLSVSHSGAGNPFFGRRHTAATKAQMSMNKVKARVTPDNEIHDFVSSLGTTNDKFVIVFHDLADNDDSHTKKIHEDKRKLAAAQGITLFQVFSDEWRDKRDIVKSMLRQRLGAIISKLGARECEVCEIDRTEAKVFFDRSHLNGHARASKCFGLRKDGEIVSAMSFRRPIQKKHGDNLIEIARFATRLDTVCSGAASKILKVAIAWARAQGFAGILTYADYRFGVGDVYRNVGFTYVKDTGVQYFYTDGKDRFDRFMYRAQPGKTERQVAEESDVRAVYGCANAVYLMMF